MFNNKEKELNAAGYTVVDGQVLDASGGPVAGEAAYGDVWYADEHVEAIMAGEVMPSLTTTTTAGSASNQAMVTVAEETTIVETEVVRARNAKGQLVGDDPSTPDINEAWTTKIKNKVTGKKKAKKD